MKKSALKKILAIGSALAIVGSLFMFAFAADAFGVGADIKELVSTFVSYIVDAFRVVGVMVAVYAVSQFALAFKDDNPEQKSKGTILLVVGLLLIFMKTIATKIVEKSGTGISLDQGFLG